MGGLSQASAVRAVRSARPRGCLQHQQHHSMHHSWSVDCAAHASWCSFTVEPVRWVLKKYSPGAERTETRERAVHGYIFNFVNSRKPSVRLRLKPVGSRRHATLGAQTSAPLLGSCVLRTKVSPTQLHLQRIRTQSPHTCVYATAPPTPGVCSYGCTE